LLVLPGYRFSFSGGKFYNLFFDAALTRDDFFKSRLDYVKWQPEKREDFPAAG
jgi:hypothetical protein